MTIIEQIKTEVERRIRSIENCPFIEAEFGASEERDGKLIAYKDLLSFLSTLESEKPMNQEGQIGSYNIVPYIDDKIAKLQDMWREEKVSFDWDDLKDMIEDVARHFAQWGAEHLADTRKTSPKDLEEAAEEYLQKVKAGFLRTLEHPTEKDCFKDGAKWQKQHDAELIEIAYNDGITIGMTKQKEQMMKEAVDMTLCDLYFGNHLEKVLAFGNRTPNGKTIRIIIVKEDEK